MLCKYDELKVSLIVKADSASAFDKSHSLSLEKFL